MGQCLITGVSGFLGSYLAELALAQGWDVYGTVRSDPGNVLHLEGKVHLVRCDILDRAQVEACVRAVQPGIVFHLAAQSLPALSWQDPDLTFRVNVFGTRHVLEAVRAVAPEATVLLAGSSAEYGFIAPEEIPVRENRLLQPASPYGVSKVAADLLARLYWRTYSIKAIVVRPFFVIGPRKSADVCSDFARGIVAVERGDQQALNVGNLEAVRDFLDVHDAVRAFWLLASRGAPGDVYNVCSGGGHRVREVLEHLLMLANTPISVEPDASRMRPADEPVVIGDNTKLAALGWLPRVPLPQTLEEVLAYWRRFENFIWA